ncbi:MAG: hypothetical protein ACOCQD_00395 [archaeon]
MCENIDEQSNTPEKVNPLLDEKSDNLNHYKEEEILKKLNDEILDFLKYINTFEEQLLQYDMKFSNFQNTCPDEYQYIKQYLKSIKNTNDHYREKLLDEIEKYFNAINMTYAIYGLTDKDYEEY